MNKLLWRLAPVLVFFVSFMAVSHAGGNPVNVIVVDMPQDVLDPMDNKCSLREALFNVNNSAQYSEEEGECPAGSSTQTNVIVLQSDVVYELIVPGAGQLEIFTNAPQELDLSIVTDGELPATIQQVASDRRVMSIVNSNVALDNLIITGGNGVNYGSGIHVDNSHVTLTRTSLLNNQANLGGGALYALNSSIEVFESRLELNNAGIPGDSGLGGAIYSQQSSLVIADSLLRANNAFLGGAILNLGEAQIFNSQLTLNQSSGAGGGAIFSGVGGDLLIEDSLFQSNSALAGNGGGLLIDSPTPGVIRRTRFESNHALNGGAIDSTFDEMLEIEGGRFIANQATQDGGAIRAVNLVIYIPVLSPPLELSNNQAGADGGAIHVETFTGNRLLVQGNEAGGRGGGVFQGRFGVIAHSRYEGNTAGTHGGGLYYAASGGTNSGSSIFRSSFMYNQANGLTGHGGGIWYGQGGTLTNLTIHANAAAAGGGLYVHDTASIEAYHLTLAGHIAGQDLVLWGSLQLQNSLIHTPGQPNCAPTGVAIDSLGNNLSNDHSCAGLDADIDLLGVNPQLLEPTNGGHHTRVLPLAATSPAINAGNNAACIAAPVQGLDQRLGIRPSGESCDIGAYEFNAEIMFDQVFSDRFEDLL